MNKFVVIKRISMNPASSSPSVENEKYVVDS
jgi:hypothetical protein